MHIFFAGSQGFERNDPELRVHIRNRLVSYHYMTKSLDKHYLVPGDHRSYIERLIMDSGAFSAWSKGATINLDDYLEYCMRYLDGISYVVNLDVIPAKPGQKNIPQEEIERSASLGWRNAQRMLRGGIPKEKLIHVFHQNENFKWLERMVREFDYIGLSPANDRTTTEKMQWLDQCMPYVTDSDGFPVVKFHGFAVTAHSLMMRYPWFSVDSASWCQQAGRGVVLIPKQKKGWDYTQMPWSVRIGYNSPFEKDAVHFFNHPERQQEFFTQYLNEKGFVLGSSSCAKIGGDVKRGGKGFLRFCRRREGCDQDQPETGCVEQVLEPGILNSHRIRSTCNALYINDFERTLIPWPEKCFDNRLLAQGFDL